MRRDKSRSTMHPGPEKMGEWNKWRQARNRKIEKPRISRGAKLMAQLEREKREAKS